MKCLLILNSKIMKRIFFLIVLLSATSAFAQQDAMYTHYMYNTLVINPAYVGSREAMTITGLNRNQWVDFKGAPVTQTFTLHTPVGSDKIGLGFSVIQDKIGPTSTTSIFADFAFRIKLTEKSKLAFGIKGGLGIFNADLPSLQLDQEDDIAFSQRLENILMPNFGFGLYYSRERFYMGLSTPKLLENKYYNGTTISYVTAAKEKGHFYFITGGVIPISKFVDLKPSALVKVTAGAPAELDLSALFEFDKRVTAGIMYRSGDAFGALCGINITEQFAVGYSFDFSMLNTTIKHNYGSHEILFRYDFVFSDAHRIKSPRYF
jgi:type IX secretion system PorP/SprF family membrane protein